MALRETEPVSQNTMTLRRSGFSKRFRHEAISDTLRSHHKMVETEAAGGRPVDRPKEFQPQERRREREEKRERYYRKQPRGTAIREGIFTVPPTPNSQLAKELTLTNSFQTTAQKGK